MHSYVFRLSVSLLDLIEFTHQLLSTCKYLCQDTCIYFEAFDYIKQQLYKTNEFQVNNQTSYKANIFVVSFTSIISTVLQFAMLVPPLPVPTQGKSMGL